MAKSDETVGVRLNPHWASGYMAGAHQVREIAETFLTPEEIDELTQTWKAQHPELIHLWDVVA